MVLARVARALPALLALCVALRAAPSAAQDPLAFRWARVEYANEGPGKLHGVGAGFDRLQNRLIVFGGRPGVLDETWQFNLTDRTWLRLADGDGDARPPPRFSMISGVDEPRNRFLVAAGEGEGGLFFNDVWAFDLASNTWSEVAAAGQPPSRRYGAAGGTYALGSEYLLVTHGFRSERYDDTFGLRLADDTWVELTPRGTVPNKRCLHGGVVTQGNALTVFGGCGSGGHGPCPARDAWTLRTEPEGGGEPSRASARWGERDQCPGPRMYSAMAVAPGNEPNSSSVDRVVMFGGDGGIFGSGSAGEVGVLSLRTGGWTLLDPSGDDRPSVRKEAALVYINHDPSETRAEDYVLLFGGTSGGGDMWRLEPDTAPGARAATKGCPFIFDLRLFHAITMFLSWGFLLPLGVAAARFSRHLPGALWFRIHRPVQALGVVLQLAGFVAAVLMVPVHPFSAMPHAGLGVVAFLLGTLQPVNAFFRPHPQPGQPKSRARVWWERLHVYGGMTALVLGMINPFWGFSLISARPVFPVLYGIWFALFWAAWLVLSLLGEPSRSAPAVWLNRLLLGGRYRLLLGAAPSETQTQMVAPAEAAPDQAAQSDAHTAAH